MKLKTNMRMEISILNGVVKTDHATGMISVNDIVQIGNANRFKKGLNPHSVARIKANKSIADFVEAVEKQIADGKNPMFTPPQQLLTRNGAGRGKETYAFLPVALKIASEVDVDFEAELYRTFIMNSILVARDDGGDEYNTLRVIIDSFLPEREGKNNDHIIINVSKMIRKKIFSDDIIEKLDGRNVWNTEYAEPLHHRMRANIEARLSDYLSNGLVRNWEHLKELIEKL